MSAEAPSDALGALSAQMDPEVLGALAAQADPEALQMYLSGACARGDMDMIRRLLDEVKLVPGPAAFSKALGHAQWAVVRLLTQRWPDLNTKASRIQALEEAAVNGHVDVLTWLHENHPEDREAFHHAAQGRACCCLRGPVAEWFSGVWPTMEFGDAATVSWPLACKEGHLDTVKFIHARHGAQINVFYGLVMACKYGQQKVVEWLVENVPGLDLQRVLKHARPASLKQYLEKKLAETTGGSNSI